LKPVLRWLLILIVAVAAIAGLYHFTMQQNLVECEACVVYKGRAESCARVAASTRYEAQSQAMSVACATVTGGVTEVIDCQSTPPSQLTCKE
jgi:hypothetical protein